MAKGITKCRVCGKPYDAAPHIETEAEKKARDFLEWAEPIVLYASTQDAVDIIRALLAERRKHGI